MRNLLILVAVILTGAIGAYAGTTGKIEGKVRDKKTGEALPGVTIRIVQIPTRGAISHPDGTFTVLAVPAGDYTLRATAVGYETVEKTHVRVSADAIVQVNFDLSSKVIQGKDTVVVIAERNPMVDRARMTTKRQFTSEQIRKIPRETVQGILSLTAGVTLDQTNGGYSIRGGRSTETSVRVDNMEISDRQTGGLGTNAIFYPTPPILGVQEVQVVAGGFAAEYGDALSGIVNTVTKEGSANQYDGEIDFLTDFPAFDGISSSGGFKPLKLAPLGQNEINFGIGGPVPEVPGLQFYVAGMGNSEQHRGEFLGIGSNVNSAANLSIPARLQLIDPLGNNVGLLPNDQLFQRSLSAKLTYEPTSDIKLTLEALNGATFYGTARWSWFYAGTQLAKPGIGETSAMPEYLTQDGNSTNLANQVSFQITQTLSQNTLYTINIGYYGTHIQFGKRNVDKNYNYLSWNGWDIYGFVDNYKGDSVAAGYAPDLIADRYYNAYVPDPATGQPVRTQNAITGHYEGYPDVGSTANPYGLQGAFISTGDESIEDLLTEYYQAYGFIQSQIDKHNLVKAGIEGDWYHTKSYINGAPWDPAAFSTGAASAYDYHPFSGDAYVQDQVEFAGVLLNPGLRLDYFNPRAYYLKDPNNFQPYYTGSPYWVQTSSKLNLSPRFGISYPISDVTQFHISYGWFFQEPNYNTLFTNLNTNPSSSLSYYVGNPNLTPQESKKYEIGFDHQLSEDFAVDIVAYYSDNYNISGTTQYSQVNAQGNNSLAYTLFSTNEYANQRGIELTLRKNLSDNYSFTGDVTFSQSRGSSSSLTQSYVLSQSSPADPYLNNQTATYYPATDYPMDFDRPLTATLIANLIYGKNEGPSIGGIHFLQHFNINITAQYQTGTPYTRLDPKTGKIIGDINGSREPDYFQTDARIERFIPLKDVFGEWAGKMQLSLFVQINNLFNTTNAMYVYATSGSPNYTGNELKLGDFDPTPWSKYGTGPSQVDAYGRLLYNPVADLNGDQRVDQQEKYQAYQRFLNDSYARRTNFQIPREVWFGATLQF